MVAQSAQATAWSADRYAIARAIRQASTRARLEARLRRAWGTIGPKMRNAALATGVEAGGDAWTGSTTRFAREWVAAGKAAHVLTRIAEEVGVTRNALKAARAEWEASVRKDVQAWTEAVAPQAAWARTHDAVARLGALIPNGLALSRWATLVRGGEALARQIEHAPPWLAAEACLHLEGRALAGDERAWRAGVVRHHAHTFGRDEELSDEAAEAALAHWRWPDAHPPLSVVAAGAGALRPIESESAWANAMRAHAHGGWEGWESALAWARKTRAGEEETRGRTIRTIESQALRWAETRWAGNAVRTLRRWAREWDANERLEGDGTRIAPALAASGEGRAPLGWTIPIEGPRTLIAHCVFEGKTPAAIARRWRDALKEIARNTAAPCLRLTLGNTLDEKRRGGEDPRHVEAWELGAPIVEMDAALGHCK